MKAYISKRASRAADRIDARWREHADDPGIFAREFLEAVVRLGDVRHLDRPRVDLIRPKDALDWLRDWVSD